MRHQQRAKLDPALSRQLNSASVPTAEAVEAVVFLRPLTANQVVVPPESIEPLVHELLDRVADHLGQSPKEFNVFRNLGSFAVSASKAFLRELLEQPEVASAVASRPG